MIAVALYNLVLIALSGKLRREILLIKRLPLRTHTAAEEFCNSHLFLCSLKIIGFVSSLYAVYYYWAWSTEPWFFSVCCITKYWAWSSESSQCGHVVWSATLWCETLVIYSISLSLTHKLSISPSNYLSLHLPNSQSHSLPQTINLSTSPQLSPYLLDLCAVACALFRPMTGGHPHTSVYAAK